LLPALSRVYLLAGGKLAVPGRQASRIRIAIGCKIEVIIVLATISMVFKPAPG
jgi:hypothetical protein